MWVEPRVSTFWDGVSPPFAGPRLEQGDGLSIPNVLESMVGFIVIGF